MRAPSTCLAVAACLLSFSSQKHEMNDAGMQVVIQNAGTYGAEDLEDLSAGTYAV